MAFCRGYLPSAEISIPALREEGDLFSGLDVRRLAVISIPALREEGDLHIKSQQERELYFYPRSPRGAPHLSSRDFSPGEDISIPALREEGDTFPRAISPLESRFLSPPSARRAT